ncbi:Gfo/Idh/MocA family protein [Lachnoclostridium phytofermentans]|uniref:Gfo/Idh/MocA family protein n=1 Tax=Lachnoclostridium phytofermentans TaxID=66219 RepID=UPI00049822A1|nr:Gfo/Idh/MocA family oxidoreductase [Lachnoclostridium phytofermentans]
MYNLAFWGFGEMAGYHLSHLLQYDKIKPVGAYDINRVRQRYAECRGLKAYKSKEELLSDPQIDIILVATSNEIHKELSIEALKAGKHVLCEKPATMNSADLEEIIKSAENEKKIFTVNQNRRVNKDFLLMKKYVENGTIGDVYAIESRVEGSKGIPDGWRSIKSMGGGMMLDWGVHLIDQIMYMRQEKVTNVFCKMYSINYKDVDDNFRLTMTFESGLTAHIEVSTNNFITHPRWYVLGNEGTLQIDDWSCDGKIIRCLNREDKWDKEITQSKAGPTKTMSPRSPESVETIILNEANNGFDFRELCTVYDQMVDAIDQKAPLIITPQQCLRVIKVMEAAFESAEKNEAIHTCI